MAPKTARQREKLSVTLERSLVEEVRSRTDNVSAFVNDAIKRKLYFQRLDDELDLLEREGVKLNETGYRWLMGKLDATEKRLKRRK